MLIRNGDAYTVVGNMVTTAEIMDAAAEVMTREYIMKESITSPEFAKQYAKALLKHLEYEVFAVLFMDTKHRLIAAEKMFRGTIDSATVYTREVVKEALRCNAKAIIVAHNHPSGISEPSQADRNITDKLKGALDLIDITLLDHLIVGNTIYSFAENGLI